MHRLARVVARNSAAAMVGQIAMKVLSFVFTVLIVRNLGAEAYGQYAGVLAFGALFVFLGDLGLSQYAVREVARFRAADGAIERTGSLYGNLLTLRLLLSTGASVLLIGAAWWTGRPAVMVGAIALGCLGLMMYAVQGTSEAILYGFERLDIAAAARVLSQLAFVVIGAALLLLDTGYYGLVIANLVGVSLTTTLCWRAVRKLDIRPRRPDPRVWLPLLRLGLPFGVIGLALGLSYKFDSVLLNIFRSDTETGMYNAAYTLVFSAVLVSNVFNTSLYPSLVRQTAAHPHELPRICERALRYLLLLSLPIAVAGWITADELIPFLFRSGYGPTADVLRILIWVVPLMFCSEFLGYIVLIQGKEHRAARAIIFSSILNVACNVLLVPRFGLFGAAVMTVLTEAVLVSQYLWLLRRLLRQFRWSPVLLRPLSAAAVMGAVLLMLRDLPPPLAVASAAACYVGLVFGLRLLGREEWQFLRTLNRDLSAHQPGRYSAAPTVD